MKNRLVIFNSFDFGSTGTLCEYLKNAKVPEFSTPLFITSQKSEKNISDFNVYEHSTKLFRYFQSLKNIFFNTYGFSSKTLTKKALKFVLKNTDLNNEKLIISIHQIESSLFDLETIINFSEKVNAKVFITLHDCWLFTGKCAYYDINKCDQWEKGLCKKCKFHKDFPYTISKHLFNSLSKKTSLFCKHSERITLICPSRWIYNELEKSKLKNLKRVVINNGIDIEKRKPINKEGKIRLVAAAYPWTKRKGLEYLEYLSNRLDYDKFELTVVGVDSQTNLNQNVKVYARTNRAELMEIFSQSDYFINPTLEDNFPTVNIEAMSCGLKIIAFNSGGACEAFDSKTGFSCDAKCVSLYEIVRSLEKNTDKAECINRALSLFSKDKFVKEYYNLFKL